MKHFLSLVSFVIFHFCFAQIQNPVTWKTSSKEEKDGSFTLVFDAKILPKWHVYSKEISPDAGIPMNLTITPSKNFKVVGSFKEIGKKINEYSEVFQAQLIYFADKVKLTQKIQPLTDKPFKVEASLEFQCCDDKVCLAPDNQVFTFELKPTIFKSNEEPHPSDSIVTTENTQPSDVVITPALSLNESGLKRNSLDYKQPLTNCGVEVDESDKSGWWLFVLGFLGGLIALLTPCVFPMIPLTVSYFTKGKNAQHKGKSKAITYAVLILVIFSLLALPFHLLEGVNPDIFNDISTNIWLNIFFFFIFLVFAFSFFGYFELTLPSWLANTSDKASSAGGFLGLFFMALTLVIISFSCTGPILGSLLAGAIDSSNGAWQLTYALIGFGLSWAIVFGLFALFPKFLASMPKSGGWMNTLKVNLGFIELALALKFLSKADLVAKTFLIKRELFIGLWVVIVIGMVLYAFKWIHFPHDDKKEKISLFRRIYGFALAALSLYLIWGMIPSERPKLAVFSGILPPAHLSYFQSDSSCPLNLSCEHDYEHALERAKKENKPILLDFTGYGCENCRKMEEFVWADEEVYNILANRVIVTSLYVDDKEELPEKDQILVEINPQTKRKITTIGAKWSVFQQLNFGANTQPHYVLITPDEKVINPPVGGYMSKEEFLNFLKCGLKEFKERKKK